MRVEDLIRSISTAPKIDFDSFSEMEERPFRPTMPIYCALSNIASWSFEKANEKGSGAIAKK